MFSVFSSGESSPLRGVYTVQGTAITVTLALWRDGVKISSVHLAGTTDDLSVLSAKVTKALVGLVVGKETTAK